jgi:hypothetical protein
MSIAAVVNKFILAPGYNHFRGIIIESAENVKFVAAEPLESGELTEFLAKFPASLSCGSPERSISCLQDQTRPNGHRELRPSGQQSGSQTQERAPLWPHVRA